MMGGREERSRKRGREELRPVGRVGAAARASNSVISGGKKYGSSS
jgi:hypothetical protein